MLLSMTGFGESHGESPRGFCAVEVRSVNNRFLKISTRISDSHQGLQDQIERTVRKQMRRGSVNVNIRVKPLRPALNYEINRFAVEKYFQQLSEVPGVTGDLIGQILTLPGVVEETTETVDVQGDWELVETHLENALHQLYRMRTTEGTAIRAELTSLHGDMVSLLEQIESAAADTVSKYRMRMQDRINSLLAEYGVSVDDATLVREIAIFSERCDIAEEVSRLRSHLAQFLKTLDSQESPGRKLDFLTQEMYREANTIGSKANDANVSQVVVDLKGKIEQAREIVQNVE